MAVPRNRHSNARKNTRRAHHAKSPKQLQRCHNCGTAIRPHNICGSCGHYAGRNMFIEAEQAAE